MDNDLKTVIGLFDNLADARNAVQDLTADGFLQSDINLIANASAEQYDRYFDAQGRYLSEDEPLDVNTNRAGATRGAEVGAVLGGLTGLLVGFSFLPVPGLGPILAGGPIVAAIGGAVAGGIIGGILGALTIVGVPEEHAGYYAEGVRRGGTLVIVKTIEARIAAATTILNRHDPVDVHQRAEAWRTAGWDRYDPAAPLYTADEIAAERRAYTANPLAGRDAMPVAADAYDVARRGVTNPTIAGNEVVEANVGRPFPPSHPTPIVNNAYEPIRAANVMSSYETKRGDDLIP